MKQYNDKCARSKNSKYVTNVSCVKMEECFVENAGREWENVKSGSIILTIEVKENMIKAYRRPCEN